MSLVHSVPGPRVRRGTARRRHVGLVLPLVMEELEHRVLLTYPGPQPIPISAAGFPPGAVAISPLTQYPTLAVANVQVAGQSVIVPRRGIPRFGPGSSGHAATDRSFDLCRYCAGHYRRRGCNLPYSHGGRTTGPGNSERGCIGGRWSRDGLVSEPGHLHPTAGFAELGPWHIARSDWWRCC